MKTEAAGPSVVTFLFTDIEGSTRLAERFPVDAPEILARHHSLIAEAAARHGGRVFEQVGDAAYVAFDDAGEAIVASLKLTVTDDGVGFDPKKTPRGHIGLVGMQQRAELIGGTFAVSSRLGSGTVVTVTWPLPAGVSS